MEKLQRISALAADSTSSAQLSRHRGMRAAFMHFSPGNACGNPNAVQLLCPAASGSLPAPCGTRTRRQDWMCSSFSVSKPRCTAARRYTYFPVHDFSFPQSRNPIHPGWSPLEGAPPCGGQRRGATGGWKEEDGARQGTVVWQCFLQPKSMWHILFFHLAPGVTLNKVTRDQSHVLSHDLCI